MSQVGYLLQIIGLGMTGYAAIAAFSLEMSEGAMFTWGIGGFIVFFFGGWMRGERA